MTKRHALTIASSILIAVRLQGRDVALVDRKALIEDCVDLADDLYQEAAKYAAAEDTR